MSTTYGNYSDRRIKKISCVRCGETIPNFNLQRLLDLDECLCDQCIPEEEQPPEAEQ